MITPKDVILLVDDEEAMHQMYKAVFKRTNGRFRLLHATSGEQALERLSREYVDLVLMDVMMGGMTGVQTLQKIREMDTDIDVVMVSAVQELRTAVSAIKLGAFDYLSKPYEIEELFATIDRVFERRKLRRENAYLRMTLDAMMPFDDMVGDSLVMKQIFGLVDLIAGSDGTVLITGESGTGKERIARSIHRRSRRGDGPFIAVNCAAIPENLLESDLFGHERGAFTSANDRRVGKFELAAGGTLFLDEIGCLPLSMQPKLLRVLQEGEIERIGGNKAIPVDVRILAATNSDLKESIRTKDFREDLFYRLNVLLVHVPPLRERYGDIPLLATHFLKKMNQKMGKTVPALTEEVVRALLSYNWPGNVRELENLVERLVTLNRGEAIDVTELPPEIRLPDLSELGVCGDGVGIRGLCTDFEREVIARTLQKVEGNQTRAAEILQIHRTTLISRMEALGLKPTRDR